MAEDQVAILGLNKLMKGGVFLCIKGRKEWNVLFRGKTQDSIVRHTSVEEIVGGMIVMLIETRLPGFKRLQGVTKGQGS